MIRSLLPTVLYRTSPPVPIFVACVAPFSYSIIDDLIDDTLTSKIRKVYDMAPMVPGDVKTYIYDKEDEYNNMYRSSKYAITEKKNEWDCLLHYEILGNKCIPLIT